ncbi:MAG: ABC transporter permease [Cyclonatronaceae bacterium]
MSAKPLLEIDGISKNYGAHPGRSITGRVPVSWDDFLIAFFTAGVGSTTLPMKVYPMIKFGVSPEINAISTITLLFTMILIFIALRIEGVSTAAKTMD